MGAEVYTPRLECGAVARLRAVNFEALRAPPKSVSLTVLEQPESKLTQKLRARSPERRLEVLRAVSHLTLKFVVIFTHQLCCFTMLGVPIIKPVKLSFHTLYARWRLDKRRA